MLISYQQTIKQPVSIEGVGLHTGELSKINILPCNVDSGIIFKRTDLNKNNIILANYKNVSKGMLCTILENEKGIKVSTVEHLLAAFFLAEIDNAIVEINNEEVPIMDGSAKDFLRILQQAEVMTQTKKRKYLKILNNFDFSDGVRKIRIEPNEKSFEVDFKLNYQNKIIGNQQNCVNFEKDELKDIINSRTFCLYEDIEKIKKLGLAKGGSLDNAIVVDQEKVLNDGGLRNKKEFVNHKILDLAGDFMLSGYRILGKVYCQQGGHELTNTFLKNLFLKKNSFCIVEANSIPISKRKDLRHSTNIAVNA